MSGIYSQKALVYLEGTLRSLCSAALTREKYECGDLIADSNEAIVKSAEEDVLPSFMRSQYFSLTERKGLPGCIVIAFPSRHGISKSKDPDGSLLLKSVLLSCLAIGMEKNYTDARFHILVITKGDDRIRLINENPEKLLLMLNPEAEDLKCKIGNLAADKALLSRSFLFKAVDSDRMYAEAELMIKGFVQQIHARFNLENKITPLASPVISTKNDAPANVVFVTSKRIWLNGELFEFHALAEGLDQGRFYIVGSLTTKNIKDTLEMIKNAINEGIEDVRFPPENEIVITLDDKCSIDATAATAFAQLMVTDLSRYKKKKIIVSSVNDGVMRRSAGYSMIREFVRVDRY